MLIRSQDKEILINFNNAPAIQIMETDGDAIIACSDTYETYTIGFYSTKAKAMKVLDMIQEAYEEYKITCTFFDRIYRTSSNCRIKRYSRQWLRRTYKKF